MDAALLLGANREATRGLSLGNLLAGGEARGLPDTHRGATHCGGQCFLGRAVWAPSSSTLLPQAQASRVRGTWNWNEFLFFFFFVAL